VSRIVIRAVLAGALAAVLLVELQQSSKLLAWEILLLVLLIWQMRDVPGLVDDRAHPLFESSRDRERSRLPRAVSAAELAVSDSLAGHMSPERRLRPVLRRLAEHRLGRHGILLDSPGAADRLGEPGWLWLMSGSEEPPDRAVLEQLVGRMEQL